MREIFDVSSARARQEKVENGMRALLTGYGRVDETSIEEVTGFSHEGDGIQSDLAEFFGVSTNSIWNAVIRLHASAEVNYGTRRGGPEDDPRNVIIHISQPSE